MRRFVLSAILIAAAAFPTFAQAEAVQAPGDDGRAAAEANRRKFVAAFAKGDAAAVAALHAPDAELLPENGRPVSGAQDIQAYWHDLLKRGARLVQLEARRLDAGVDVTFEVGSYVMTTQPGPGQTVVHSGNYLVAWRRQQDGGWLAAAAIWNKGKAEPAK